MWMPAGSFWTQPKGEVHITAAKGSTNVALVEIDQGPYLVLPPNEAFESGERPINVDVSNIIWVDPPENLTSVSGAKIAYLWGQQKTNQANGVFIKLPADFSGRIDSDASSFRAVVIQGEVQYLEAKTNIQTLDSGSYFGSQNKWIHKISSPKDQSVILYVRSEGKFKLLSN